MDRERIDTRSNNWQSWSIRLPFGILAGIIGALWLAFNLYTQVHDNSYEVERVEGRLDKKTERLDQRITEVERIIHDLECPPESH